MNELATALAKLKRMLVDETKEPRPFSNFHNLLTQTKIDAMKATRSKVKEVLARVGESAASGDDRTKSFDDVLTKTKFQVFKWALSKFRSQPDIWENNREGEALRLKLKDCWALCQGHQDFVNYLGAEEAEGIETILALARSGKKKKGSSEDLSGGAAEATKEDEAKPAEEKDDPKPAEEEDDGGSGHAVDASGAAPKATGEEVDDAPKAIGDSSNAEGMSMPVPRFLMAFLE